MIDLLKTPNLYSFLYVPQTLMYLRSIQYDIESQRSKGSIKAGQMSQPVGADCTHMIFKVLYEWSVIFKVPVGHLTKYQLVILQSTGS